MNRHQQLVTQSRKARRICGASGLALAIAAATMGQVPAAVADQPEAAEVALVWQQAALATVPFSPAQSLYLSFTSRAVDRAVQHSLKREASSETAAVAQAAHDVLVEYFPAATSALDAKLASSLGDVP